jgi:hypothetical protein
VASWGDLDVTAKNNAIELEFIERTSPRARDLALARSAAAAAAGAGAGAIGEAGGERRREDAFTAAAASLGDAANAAAGAAGAAGMAQTLDTNADTHI